MVRPESIHRAWWETDYRVRLPAGGYASIRCGRPLPGVLLDLLPGTDAPWGYLTAWNPAGVRLPARTNRIRLRRLRDELKADQHRYYIGIGVGTSGWRETSLFVPGIRYAHLDALARRFGQSGLVRGTGAAPAELHDLI
ncbi:MAG: DUF3293 domain-containing protein [Rhodanobacteraceae bacterium]|nr:MAG: DUF3293 domain-containing protein [Rhodanobacteraceae bacterium]